MIIVVPTFPTGLALTTAGPTLSATGFRGFTLTTTRFTLSTTKAYRSTSWYRDW